MNCKLTHPFFDDCGLFYIKIKVGHKFIFFNMNLIVIFIIKNNIFLNSKKTWNMFESNNCISLKKKTIIV